MVAYIYQIGFQAKIVADTIGLPSQDTCLPSCVAHRADELG